MKKAKKTVQRRSGANKIDVTVPNGISLYQMKMDGTNRGDQHRVMGTRFANVLHLKTWYKKVSLGVADFNSLNVFAAWNLLVDDLERNNRGWNRGGNTKG